MFDIGWTELLMVAVVAILVVGPKDLPRMLRSFGNTIGGLRRMASEFQGQFNEALREAEQQAGLDEAKKSMSGLSNPLGDVDTKLDPLAGIDKEIASPVKPKPAKPATETVSPASAPFVEAEKRKAEAEAAANDTAAGAPAAAADPDGPGAGEDTAKP